MDANDVEECSDEGFSVVCEKLVISTSLVIFCSFNDSVPKLAKPTLSSALLLLSPLTWNALILVSESSGVSLNTAAATASELVSFSVSERWRRISDDFSQ